MAAQVGQAEGIIMSKKSAMRDNFVVTYQALVDRLRDRPYFINFRNILCSRTEPVINPMASICRTGAAKSSPGISTRS